jgi:hypothetical protein
VRWIVYALLGVNLALLTWNLHTRSGEARTADPPLTAARAGAELNQLPLLVELEGDGLRARVPAAGPSAGAGPVQETAQGSERLQAPEQGPTGPKSTRPEPRPESLAVAGAQNPTPDALPSPAVPPLPAGAAAPPCFTVGPLGEDAPLQALREWLEARGATVDVRSDERREVALYWIYFPPTSREEAVAQVARLREQGVSDVLVVPKGDMANAVSLGVFSRTDSRDRRLRELNAKGYQPSIGPRYRTKRATWIDVSAPPGAVTPDALRKEWPDTDVAPAACAGARIAARRAGSYNSEDASPGRRRFFFSGQERGTSPAPGPGQ